MGTNNGAPPGGKDSRSEVSTEEIRAVVHDVRLLVVDIHEKTKESWDAHKRFAAAAEDLGGQFRWFVAQLKKILGRLPPER